MLVFKFGGASVKDAGAIINLGRVVSLFKDEQMLIAEFRRQLEQGMWAAIPVQSESGRREAEMVHAFEEIPRAADRVIFFPRAAGGSR